MRQRRWIELFSDYDSEICYHPRKANVVADAFSMKERVKPRRVRAMSMTIRSSVTDKILAAQGEASKVGNVTAEMLRGLDQQMEKKEDADKMYYNLRDIHWWPCMKKDVATYVSNCLTCSKVKAETSKTFGYRKRLQDENLARIYIDEIVARHGVLERLKAARDRQKSYADNRRKPLEFKVGDQVLLKVSPWKGVVRFRKKGKLAPRYVGPFEILERIGPVAYREVKIDKTLCFVDEPVVIMNREVKKLKRSRILIVKVHWNLMRGLEDFMKAKYPHLFVEQVIDGSYSISEDSEEEPIEEEPLEGPKEEG
ncbi:putative reverse transcriptase domain-containing protein [Tanacetum coccineum]